MSKERNNNTEAVKEQPDAIIMIPVEKIKPFRWSTGIRDKEKYELLKENIKEHGLNNPIKVRLLEDGNYEPFIGDHRAKIVKDLKWKEVPCIVDNIDIDEALEICVSDNLCRADYNPIEIEDKISELWNSQKYKSRAELGRKIGLTGERIGQLIFAKKIRDKSKVPLDESISTQSIIDTKSLESDEDKIALLKLLKMKKVKPSEIKTTAVKLSKINTEERNRVLYEGADLADISKEIQTKIQEKIPKETKTTITVSKECMDLVPKLYSICNEMGNFIGLMDNGKREQALEYIKVCAGLLLEILKKEKSLAERTFDTFVKEALHLDVNILHKYDGSRTTTIEWWI